MAKAGRPEMQICPACGGRGSVPVATKRVDSKGKVHTDHSTKPCATCNWKGFIPGRSR